MSEFSILVEMMRDIQETVNGHSVKLASIETSTNIEIPAIKNNLEDSQDQLEILEAKVYALDKQILTLNTSIGIINEMIEAMKPLIQFFTFVKWASVGVIMFVGWVGSNATGLSDFIGKFFHK